MKKDLLSLASFLLKNDCICQYEQEKIILKKDGLKIEIGSPLFVNEYVILSLKTASETITQIVQALEAKDLIIGFWEKIEKSSNKGYINKYGKETYDMFYNGFIAALNGEEENEHFKFNVEKDQYAYKFILTEKSSNNIYTGRIALQDRFTTYKPKYREHIHTCLVITENTETKKGQFSNDLINVFVPALKLGVNKLLNYKGIRFNDDTLFDYLIAQNDNNISPIISVFELENDLNTNNPTNKKLKL